MLKIGTNAPDNVIFNVTGGWLEVAEELMIGADPAATVTFNLSGGKLDTSELSKGAGGSFNFTGGTLHADTVNFDLVNNGGTLSPGHSVGQTHVVGDLALTSGSLAVELASTASADSLLVDGQVTLGGALDVSLLGSFTPTLGDNWQIISAGGISGTFSSITAGYSLQQQGHNLLLYFGAAPPLVLAGDYNDDDVVDAADYTVWRDSLASMSPLVNETASLGVVDAADYAAWKANFGAVGSGSGSAGALSAHHSVPEPSSSILLALGLSFSAAKWCRSGTLPRRARS